MNNETVNNERVGFRGQVTRHWWRMSIVFAALFIVDILSSAFLPALTVRYWFAGFEKNDLAGVFANIILLLVLPFIALTWVAKGTKLWVRILASLLTFLVAVTALPNTVVQALSSERGFFAEQYVDSAMLGDSLYHLTFLAGISGGQPAYHIYRCDRYGLVCEGAILNAPAHQVLLHEGLPADFYPLYATFLISNSEQDVLYIQEGESIIYEYHPHSTSSP